MKLNFAILGACAALLAAPATQAQSDMRMGDIITVGFNFCPRGYAETNGQLLAISTHQALFSLLGTTYGGDGNTTFALPDLRGRVPIGLGEGPGLPDYEQGETFGAETETLLTSNMAQHNHTALGSVAEPDSEDPGGNSLASFDGPDIYHSGSPSGLMAPSVVSNTGGSQPFYLWAPTIAIRTCIATEGIFPSRG